MLMKASALIALMCACAGVYAQQPAAEFTPGPMIEGYGRNAPVADLDFPAREGHVYKVVFDVSDGPEDPATPNRGFDTPARFLNMHARAGTPAEDLHVAVVVHGQAARGLQKNAAYKAQTGVDNPNIELLERLTAAGVEVVLCGQTAAYYGYSKDKLLPGVKTALSAMTALSVLQSQGYTLNPF